MIVMSMIVMAMRLVPMSAFRIGPAFGIERRRDLDDARAQSLHHGFDDMVAADPQRLGHDLRRQMAVTEMPGEPHQMMRIGAANFQQRLGRGDHFNQPAIIEHQRIAAAQGCGVLQIQQELKPARARHRHPPPMPIIEIEHDGVNSGFSPTMLSKHARGADHAEILILSQFRLTNIDLFRRNDLDFWRR
jgi:hypothetical protein